MHSLSRLAFGVLVCSVLAPSQRAAAAEMQSDLYAQVSTLPSQYPAFDRVHDADFPAAFTAALAEHDREVAAIAGAKSPATFENTVLAFEQSGRRLHRVSKMFYNLLSSRGDDELQKIDTDLAPRLSIHSDNIYLNAALFHRIETVYQSTEKDRLDPESRQLLERTYIEFVHSGARLSAADRAKLKQVNARLATLNSTFRQHVLESSKANAVLVEQRSELDGLDEARISAAAKAANERAHPGKWLIAITNTTDQPVLANLNDRALRERIYRASITRASSGPNDNRGVVVETIKLRADKAHLLGFPTYADLALSEEGAATPQAANQLLERIASASLADTRHDAKALQALMDADLKAKGKPATPLQPWDWAYYSDRLRKQRFTFDQSEVKAYFEMNRVMQDGLFYAAHELFGLTFKERHDLPTYTPDVRVFDVFDDHGTQIAIFLADYFAREGKGGGAWMDTYVDQSKLFGTRPVVVNNLNLVKPEAGQPVLLSFDEVVGMFHEFGHALHGMLSDVRYESLSGTDLPADFVEYPSQCNEMWARDPKVVAHFAFHYQNGTPMPPELLRQVIAAQQFNTGFLTSEYVIAAILDMAWHSIPGTPNVAAADVAGFETEALKKHNVFDELAPPRYHTTYFSHAFSGDQYAAGYYAYLWSEVLARDTGQWIYAHGGLSRTAGNEYRDKVLSRGRTSEPGALFKSLYGRDADVAPLIEYRGLGKQSN